MSPNMVGAVLAVLLVAALDGWVYADARARQGTRREVTATIGSMNIDRPEVWMAWCLTLFVFFFPLYLIARREAEWTAPAHRADDGPALPSVDGAGGTGPLPTFTATRSMSEPPSSNRPAPASQGCAGPRPCTAAVLEPGFPAASFRR